MDCHLARQLATRVVSVPPFMPIPDSAVKEALALMREGDRIINAGLPAGAMDTPIRELVEQARALPGYVEA